MLIKKSGRGAWEGFGLGLLYGGAAGSLIGLASGDDPESDWFGLTAVEKAVRNDKC